MIRLTAVIEVDGQAPRALTHESNATSVILGRDASADFQIPLSTVSRQHVRICLTDNVYVIEDLNSTHGTMVNGRKLEKGEKKVLRNGDVIELTKAKITASIEEEKVASADPSEGTQAIAARAVQGILGRLGEAKGEGPYFRVIGGPDEGARYSLVGTSTEWALGRSKDCEFVINDPNVSRRHALVKKDWNGYTIQDLGSKNGVLVNDKLIHKPRRLRDREEITIGPVKLLFIDPDAKLLEALKDVPGFADESSEASEVIPAEQQADAVGPDGAPIGDVPAPPEGEAPPTAAPMPPAEPEGPDLAAIDPELLEPAESKLPIEWVVIPLAGLLVVLVIVLIFYLVA